MKKSSSGIAAITTLRIFFIVCIFGLFLTAVFVADYQFAGGDDSMGQVNPPTDEYKKIFPQWDQYEKAGLIMNVHKVQKLPSGGRIILESIIFDFSSTKVIIRVPDLPGEPDRIFSFKKVEIIDNLGNDYSASGEVGWRKGDELWCAVFPPVYPGARSLKLFLSDIYKYGYESEGKKTFIIDENAGKEFRGYRYMYAALPSDVKKFEEDEDKRLGRKLFANGKWMFKISIQDRDFSKIIKEIPLNKKFNLRGHNLLIKKLILTPADTILNIPYLEETLCQIYDEKEVLYAPLLADNEGDKAPLRKIERYPFNMRNKEIQKEWIMANRDDFYRAEGAVKLNKDSVKIDFLCMNNGDIVKPGIVDRSTENLPLHYAAMKGNKELAESWILKSADINDKDDTGKTPLYVAAEYGQEKVAELLVSKGADINTKAYNGMTPLLIAIERGHKEIVELLLSKGIDVNAKDEKGQTLLHFAAEKGTKEIVELLLSRGADVNARDNHGRTPLLEAAFSAPKEVVELLLTRGADVNVKDDKGFTPLRLALFASHKSVIELLRRHGAKE